MHKSVLTIDEVSDGVVQLTMHDRDFKNTFSSELSAALIDTFKSVSRNPKYRAVVITGYDTYFCCGGTRETLISLHEGKGKFTDSDLYRLPLDCEIPVIAAMQGHGIGGGLVFGLFSDFAIFSRESIYTTNFMKFGFTPGMGATHIIPDKLGVSLGIEMLISARDYRGDELAQRGMPHPVLPRADVLPAAIALAKDIAEKPRLSLVTLKSHLISTTRQVLPSIVSKEIEMHSLTFHQPSTKDRIEKLFGS
ncbi:MAG: polyketide synthase [Pseudomonadota bacterium]